MIQALIEKIRRWIALRIVWITDRETRLVAHDEAPRPLIAIIGREHYKETRRSFPIRSWRELAATIFHLLGIAPSAEFHDPIGRPRTVTDGGQPIRELVG